MLAGASCAEPPAKERHQAEGAVAAARAADAAVYAPQELNAAEAALRQYDEAAAQRDYRLALDHALEARDRALDAARQAGERKAAARSQAERLLAELEALTAAATARLAASGNARLTGAAADRLRASVKDASSAMQEARTRIERQAYPDAVQVLAPIVERLQLDLPPAPAPGGRRGGK
jgi:hypothetical protein